MRRPVRRTLTAHVQIRTHAILLLSRKFTSMASRDFSPKCHNRLSFNWALAQLLTIYMTALILKVIDHPPTLDATIPTFWNLSQKYVATYWVGNVKTIVFFKHQSVAAAIYCRRHTLIVHYECISLEHLDFMYACHWDDVASPYE